MQRMDGQAWDGVRGKRVVMTGATNGIGLAAARQLAGLGAQLSIVGRSPGRAQQAATSIAAAAPGSPAVDVLVADLASQDALHRLSEEILRSSLSRGVDVGRAAGVVDAAVRHEIWMLRQEAAAGRER